MPSKWDIHAPWVRIIFVSPNPEALKAFYRDAEKVPGVKRKGKYVKVPRTAAEIVADLAVQWGVDVKSAAWIVKPPSQQYSWEEVDAALRAQGEVKPTFLGDWPRDFQKEGIAAAWAHTGFHLWHSTGAGKTFSGIVLMTALKGTTLIVTRSAAKIQFGREIERFTGARPYVIRAASSMRKRKLVAGQTWKEFFAAMMPELGKADLVADAWKALQAEHGVQIVVQDETIDQYMAWCEAEGQRPWIVVGWEALVDHYPKLAALRPTCVLYDEQHMGKSSKRWDQHPLPPLDRDPIKAAAQLVQWEGEAKAQGGFLTEPDEEGVRSMMVPILNRAAAAGRLARTAKKRVALTATPVADRVRDLWGQLDTIEPNAWGNKTVWEHRYCNARQGTYGWDTTGASNIEELAARLEHITHKVPAHIAMAHLRHLKRRQSVYIDPADLAAPLPGFAAELRSAQQRGGSAVLEVLLAQSASRKRKAVVDLIDDCIGSGQKVVVFTGRKADCEALGKALHRARYVKAKKKEGTFDMWVAHGDTGAEQRQGVVDSYMKHPGPCLLVGTGDAFGESINLDDTDAAFFVMLPYTPGWLRQWEGRFVRLSMKRAVIIYYVIAEDTVDELQAERLISKLPAVEEIAEDHELAEAAAQLAGLDATEDEEAWAESILSVLDF